jgi:hypothetical protein
MLHREREEIEGEIAMRRETSETSNSMVREIERRANKYT